MAWFKRPQYASLRAPQLKDRIPDGLWAKCPSCGEVLLSSDFNDNLRVCPKCDHHDKIPVHERMAQIVDEGTFVESDADMTSADPLGFVDEKPYPERMAADREKTGLNEAVVTGVGLHGVPLPRRQHGVGGR